MGRAISGTVNPELGQLFVKNCCVSSLTCLVLLWYPGTLDRLEMRPL